VADREHAGVDGVQPAGSNPKVDRVLAQPEVSQLSPGNHAVLLGRQRRGPDILSMRLPFAVV
jgi:hypothetical protein